MLIINHRCNALESLQDTNPLYGCEIDIRNHGKELFVTHDAFIDSAMPLSEWLINYKHAFLILNVKEEGLEEKLIPLLDRFCIDHYFILDESFPYIRKWALKGLSKFAVRVSDLECVETPINLQKNLKFQGKKVDWVWVDTFSGSTITKRAFLLLSDAGYKTCLVSPELHWPEDSEKSCFMRISNFVDQLRIIGLKPDAVCTRAPDIWKGFVGD